MERTDMNRVRKTMIGVAVIISLAATQALYAQGEAAKPNPEQHGPGMMHGGQGGMMGMMNMMSQMSQMMESCSKMMQGMSMQHRGGKESSPKQKE
jgi:periplasmic protein CpxP/Spy